MTNAGIRQTVLGLCHNVHMCFFADNCYNAGDKGSSYLGNVDTAEDGKKCVQSSYFPEMGTFCRMHNSHVTAMMT